jgi:microcystin degradation protein MlrC
MSELTVLVGGISHETNTFAAPTTRERFREHHEYVGEEIPAKLRDTNTQLGGCIEFADTHDVELAYSTYAAAVPGGPVTADAYEHYTEQILERARELADEIDGVKLALHGAMVAETTPHGEATLVRRVRDVVGDSVPIAVSLDLHGNLSDDLLSVADVVVGFETYPHVDMGDAGYLATEQLFETVTGDLSPVVSVERPPLLPLGPKQNTRTGPMADVMAKAREYESRDGVRKVNVFIGFHQCDVPAMGMSIPVVTDDDPQLGTEIARELAADVWDRRDDFIGEYPGPAEAVRQAKQRATELQDDDNDDDDDEEDAGFVLLADIGDNPGGGGTADTTVVLRELLEQSVPNAGFALICDPAVVDACVAAGVGNRVTVDLGGKTENLDGGPIRDLDVYVKAITDGEFVNTGPMATGSETDLGEAVLLHCGPEDSISVIVARNRVQPLDAEIWRHVGVQPERFDVVAVKSSNHYRADYEPMSAVNIPINSPGLVAMDPRHFDFSQISRPKYPLDEMTGEEYPDWA